MALTRCCSWARRGHPCTDRLPNRAWHHGAPRPPEEGVSRFGAGDLARVSPSRVATKSPRSPPASTTPRHVSNNWCAPTRCCWPTVPTSCARRFPACGWRSRSSGPDAGPRRAGAQYRRARCAHRRAVADEPAGCGQASRTRRARGSAGARGRRGRAFRSRSDGRAGDTRWRSAAAAAPDPQPAGERANTCGRRERHPRPDHESGARIVVEDAGPGIPDEDRERIFEPFYGDATRRNPPVQAWASPSCVRSRVFTAAT